MFKYNPHHLSMSFLSSIDALCFTLRRKNPNSRLEISKKPLCLDVNTQGRIRTVSNRKQSSRSMFVELFDWPTRWLSSKIRYFFPEEKLSSESQTLFSSATNLLRRSPSRSRRWPPESLECNSANRISQFAISRAFQRVSSDWKTSRIRHAFEWFTKYRAIRTNPAAIETQFELFYSVECLPMGAAE